MRLLDKKIIASEVASQKKAQIDQGVAIAKKVDALRETLGTLELQHSRFLEGMQGELIKRTEKLHEKIRLLEAEISILEAKRKVLLEPLTLEWENVKIKERETEKTQALVQSTLEKIEASKKSLENNLKTQKDILAKIKIRERELEKTLSTTENLKREAESINLEAKTQRQSQYEQQMVAWKEIETAASQVEFHRLANEHQKEIFEIKERELLDKERQINDRYATLLRTEERIKQ